MAEMMLVIKALQGTEHKQSMINKMKFLPDPV